MTRALLLLATVACQLGIANADPGEAERRLADAKALRGRHWSLVTTALGDAGRAARARSAPHVRTLRSLATTWKRAGRTQAALAAHAAAARAAYPGESARFTPRLSGARLLDRENDIVGAILVLEAVASDAGVAARDATERALAHLVALHFERRDRGAVAALASRLDRIRASSATRIVACGRLGELALDAADVRAAEVALRRAGRLYADARDDAKAVKAWLDLPLRRRSRK